MKIRELEKKLKSLLDEMKSVGILKPDFKTIRIDRKWLPSEQPEELLSNLGNSPLTIPRKEESSRAEFCDYIDCSLSSEFVTETESGNRAYLHYNGNFMEIVWSSETAKIKKVDFEECKTTIFDLNIKNYDFSFGKSISASLLNIAEEIARREEDFKYIPSRYIKEVTVEVKVPDDRIYSKKYGILREEGEAIDNWRREHLQKYHKEGIKCRGVTPVSNFKIEIGWTGLGDYVSCECSICKNNGLPYEEYCFNARDIG